MNNSFNKTEKRGNDNMEVKIGDRVITKSIKLDDKRINEIESKRVNKYFDTNFNSLEEIRNLIHSFNSVIQNKDHNSFILYQEQLTKIIENIGFSTEETHKIMKVIAKGRFGIDVKSRELKERFMQEFKNKVLKTENITNEKALEITKMSWQLIENSFEVLFLNLEENNKQKYLEFKLKDISNLDEILKVIDIMEQNDIMKATQININNEINMPLRVNNIERSNDDIESIAQKFEGCIIHKDNELKIGEASIKFELKL